MVVSDGRVGYLTRVHSYHSFQLDGKGVQPADSSGCHRSYHTAVPPPACPAAAAATAAARARSRRCRRLCASLRGAEGPARAASGALASGRAGGAGRGGAPAGAARGAPAAPAPLEGLCKRARCIAAQIRKSALPCGWWRNHSASVASRHASRTPANWGEPGGGHGGCAAAMASRCLGNYCVRRS